MLAARYREPGQNHWPINEHESGVEKLSALRMSKPYSSSLSTHSEWPVPSRHTHHHGTGDEVPSYDRSQNGPAIQPPRFVIGKRASDMDIQVKQEWQPEHNQSIRDVPDAVQHQSSVPSNRTPPGLELEPSLGASGVQLSESRDDAAGEQWLDQDSLHGHLDNDVPQRDGDEEDECMEEDDGEEGDGDNPRPQTAAERSAARRKMKRFRYCQPFVVLIRPLTQG